MYELFIRLYPAFLLGGEKMSEWDFTWGLTGKELEEAQTSGLAPDEYDDAFDENEDEESYAYCIRCQKCRKVYAVEHSSNDSKVKCPHCGTRFNWSEKFFEECYI